MAGLHADKLVLTATDDPGPGEKGHVPVQVGADYRVGMAVPEGVYAVWVVPANGARPRKAEDRARVHAGRTTRVGDGITPACPKECPGRRANISPARPLGSLTAAPAA